MSTNPLRPLWYPTDQTLGTGNRITNITITATPTSLDALLNAAVTGRASMPGRRVLKIRNMNGSNPFYILESSTQTTANGWNIESGGTFEAEGSESYTGNAFPISEGGAGFYLACASGTIAAKVLEAR